MKSNAVMRQCVGILALKGFRVIEQGELYVTMYDSRTHITVKFFESFLEICYEDLCSSYDMKTKGLYTRLNKLGTGNVSPAK